jgi:hypothetical protein
VEYKYFILRANDRYDWEPGAVNFPIGGDRNSPPLPAHPFFLSRIICCVPSWAHRSSSACRKCKLQDSQGLPPSHEPRLTPSPCRTAASRRRSTASPAFRTPFPRRSSATTCVLPPPFTLGRESCPSPPWPHFVRSAYHLAAFFEMLG